MSQMEHEGIAVNGEPRTIRELAKHADSGSKMDTRRARYRGVPITAFMLFILIAVLCGSIIPTSVMIFRTSTDTVDILSTQIALATIKSCAEKLNVMMIRVKDTVEVFMLNAELENMMLRETTGYDNHPNLTVVAMGSIEKMGNALSINCFQRENLTGQIPLSAKTPDMVDYRNMSLIMFLNTPESDYVPGGPPPGALITWADYSNSSYALMKMVDTNTGATLSPNIPVIAPVVHPTKAAWRLGEMVSSLDDPNRKPLWKSEISLNNTYLSYIKPGSDGFAPITGPGLPPFICAAPMKAGKDIFDDITPTSNTRILVIGKSTKLILSNRNISLADASDLEFIDAVDASDPIISELGSLVMTQYNGNVSTSTPIDVEMLSVTTSQSFIRDIKLKSDNNEQWIMSIIPLSFGTEDRFVVVIAIPRKEYFGDIDQAMQKGTIISSVIASVGFLVSAGLFVIITMPLRTIGKNMQKVSNFDFSMLSKGVFIENNFFLEIRNLEISFNNMVKAFAGGIKVNKEMMASRLNPSGKGNTETAAISSDGLNY